MEWKTLLDYPAYEISECGNIRRLLPSKTRKAGTLLNPSPDKDGYLAVSLRVNGGSVRRRINRLVCEAFNGKPPCGNWHAAHNDGRLDNNHWSNLRWATVLDNTADRRKHGTQQLGAKVHNALLDESAVRHIRTAKLSAHEMATLYNVSVSTIHAVRYRRNWRHVA